MTNEPNNQDLVERLQTLQTEVGRIAQLRMDGELSFTAPYLQQMYGGHGPSSCSPRLDYAINSIQFSRGPEGSIRASVVSYLNHLEDLARFVERPEDIQSHLPERVRNRNWGKAARAFFDICFRQINNYNDFCSCRDDAWRAAQDWAYTA
ncbi:hypothetical protein HY485_02165 [Candidatus Woesearchaeota archaeon]|nr:hypothetical protein [Candidatus Woesearchaeota archaeon]